MVTGRVAVRPGDGVGATVLDVSDEQVVVGEGVALDVRPAGFMLRAASGLIDAIATFLFLFLLIWAFASALEGNYRLTGQRPDAALAGAMVTSLIVGTLVLTPLTVETLTRGRSLGRFIMGLRIVRDDGGAAGFRHALIRALVGFFELFATSGGIAILTGLLNARSKRLGDLLAGTYAQNERAPRLTATTSPLPHGLEAWANVADVATLPDRVARRMRDYLTQAPRLEPAARFRTAGVVAREVKEFVHPIPDVDADTFLRAVAAVRRQREATALELRRARRTHLATTLDALPNGFPQRG